jgi:RNA polymerase sigma-70 factor (ECF subfamily)
MRDREFRQSFEEHVGFLKNFAKKLTNNSTDADDLFQDMAFKAFKNKSKFKPGTNMRAWLVTIMKNAFINTYRKRKRRNELLDFTAEDHYLNAGNTVVQNDGEQNVILQELFSFVNKLDEVYKNPFLMAYQGYSYEEIQMSSGGVPMGTIKSRIFLARKKIKEGLSNVYAPSLN